MLLVPPIQSINQAAVLIYSNLIKLASLTPVIWCRILNEDIEVAMVHRLNRSVFPLRYAPLICIRLLEQHLVKLIDRPGSAKAQKRFQEVL